jgi:hypothetical protein
LAHVIWGEAKTEASTVSYRPIVPKADRYPQRRAPWLTDHSTKCLP